MNWKKLQNGSDIRGVALEGIEGALSQGIAQSQGALDPALRNALEP